VPQDLYEQVVRQLKRAALDTLSLARKAGEATFGFEKVRQMLKRGDVAVLVEAHDGASDGKNKLAALKKALESDIPVVETFSAAELGLAFDRERVIHAAIRPGGLARKFLRLADKLARLQTDMETNEQ
jgi:ribosomal protein L7Ae-like RNA K-turn-binding protein